MFREGKRGREFLSKNCQENITRVCVRLNKACGMCYKATGFHMDSLTSRNVRASTEMIQGKYPVWGMFLGAGQHPAWFLPSGTC